MKQFTQCDLVVLYLAEKGDWVKSYDLKGKFYNNQIIGSEGDRRAIELFDKNKEEAEREIDKVIYKIIRAKEGKYRKYKVVNAVPKPLNSYQLLHIKMQSETVPNIYEL